MEGGPGHLRSEYFCLVDKNFNYLWTFTLEMEKSVCVCVCECGLRKARGGFNCSSARLLSPSLSSYCRTWTVKKKIIFLLHLYSASFSTWCVYNWKSVSAVVYFSTSIKRAASPHYVYAAAPLYLLVHTHTHSRWWWRRRLAEIILSHSPVCVHFYSRSSLLDYNLVLFYSRIILPSFLCSSCHCYCSDT